MPEIKFPIKITGIEFSKREVHNPKTLTGAECGDLVSVRPCDAEFKGKTFLGVLLGEFALSQMVSFDKDTKKLNVSLAMHNPAIFVPSLRRIVWGCGSFWGRIKDESELCQISDDDIANVWYVKALRDSGTDSPLKDSAK